VTEEEGGSSPFGGARSTVKESNSEEITAERGVGSVEGGFCRFIWGGEIASKEKKRGVFTGEKNLHASSSGGGKSVRRLFGRWKKGEELNKRT